MANEKAPAEATNDFRLSELIEHVADELRTARKTTDDPTAIMEFQSCEVELAVTVRKEGSAGFRFHVIEAGGKLGSDNTSRVKLVFGPIEGQRSQFKSIQQDITGPPPPKRETPHGQS